MNEWLRLIWDSFYNRGLFFITNKYGTIHYTQLTKHWPCIRLIPITLNVSTWTSSSSSFSPSFLPFSLSFGSFCNDSIWLFVSLPSSSSSSSILETPSIYSTSSVLLAIWAASSSWISRTALMLMHKLSEMNHNIPAISLFWKVYSNYY